jgi:hypothetical protein
MAPDNDATKPIYSEAQLSKYQSLVRQATRWLFSGDVAERIDAANAEADIDMSANMPKKRKRSKVRPFGCLTGLEIPAVQRALAIGEAIHPAQEPSRHAVIRERHGSCHHGCAFVS